MKTLKDFIYESKTAKEFEIALEDLTLDILKDAAFGSSFMDDRSYIKIDGNEYYKIKPDGWQNTSGNEHVLHGIVSSQDIFDLIQKSKEVELHLMK